MHCYRCERAAVDRCYTCGALFCEEHGNVNCEQCDTAIAPGDCRPDRITARPRTERPQQPWWRPQPADDFEPPSCYQCRGLARRVCRNCRNRYCPEHAGKNDLCAACMRSSNVGLLVLLASLAAMGLLILLGFWR
jgi:hypothetical protein